MFAKALIVDKEEGLVFANRYAEGAAEIVTLQGGDTLAVGVVEPGVGVHHGVSEELVSAAVELVGAGARDDVDDGADCKTVLGGEVGLLDLELLDRVDRRRVKHVLDAAVLVEVGGTGAVNEDVGGCVTAAVRVEIDAALGVLSARRIGFSNARRQVGKVGEVAID